MKQFYYVFIVLLCINSYAQNNLEHFDLKGNVSSLTEIVYEAIYDNETKSYMHKDTIAMNTSFFRERNLLKYSIHKRFKSGDSTSTTYVTYYFKNDTLIKAINRRKPREFKGENPIESIANVIRPELNKLVVDVVSESDSIFHFQNIFTFKENRLNTFIMRDLKYSTEPVFSESYEYNGNGDVIKITETTRNSVTTIKHLKYDKYKNSLYSVSSNKKFPDKYEVRERFIKYND